MSPSGVRVGRDRNRKLSLRPDNTLTETVGLRLSLGDTVSWLESSMRQLPPFFIFPELLKLRSSGGLMVREASLWLEVIGGLSVHTPISRISVTGESEESCQAHLHSIWGPLSKAPNPNHSCGPAQGFWHEHCQEGKDPSILSILRARGRLRTRLVLNAVSFTLKTTVCTCLSTR